MQINKTQNIQTRLNYQKDNEPYFKGAGAAAMEYAGKFFQVCDDIPMIGVAFTDTAATNVPRTVVDLKETGVPAAAETARREFSGLFVNCLLPGAFVYGAAKILNYSYMKDFKNASGSCINIAKSWADEESLRNLIGVWQKHTGLEYDLRDIKDKDLLGATLDRLDKAKFAKKGFIRSTLSSIEGLNGVNSWDKLSDHKEIIEEAANILSPFMSDGGPKGLNIIKKIRYNRRKNEIFNQAYSLLINGEYTYKNEFGKKVTKVVEKGGGFKAAQTLKFDGKNVGANLRNLLRDTMDIGTVLATSENVRQNPNAFLKKAVGLVNAKSLAGLAVVVPLAMSMQYINRAITRHKYKKTGAPIYKDFEDNNRVLTSDEKKKLSMAKPLAISSIVGLAGLSMGKGFPKSIKDAVKMLQFNTKFPTLNQCRVIATFTFASRMLASEDSNELREGTVRDLASFAGLYFLGDYAEKLAATAIQKFSKPGREGKLQMLNKTKDPSEYKNIFQKFAGWVKDTNIKTFDEIPKEYTNYRSAAKIGGLGFSIALLGILLPMYNKHVTNKKEAKRKAILEQQKNQKTANNVTFKPYVSNIFGQNNKIKVNSVFSEISNKYIK